MVFFGANYKLQIQQYCGRLLTVISRFSRAKQAIHDVIFRRSVAREAVCCASIIICLSAEALLDHIRRSERGGGCFLPSNRVGYVAPARALDHGSGETPPTRGGCLQDDRKVVGEMYPLQG